uniref:Uncharacterized protein n=1 Tax=Guillardia theta TaxID=55529 RepID=A0A7S4P025_GUITH|mmetsp:Transcript_4002/g.14858  ORF Transcript_4002/g.14858 Transcript_4002/m.14858 type:complete len:464 (+) Transcript_4002:70-1461(+)
MSSLFQDFAKKATISASAWKDSLKPNLSSLKPNLVAFKEKFGEFVADVQEELGRGDDLRYEWNRLQTFVDWPLDKPRPAELAKAGFFFVPAADAPDRCAHFCADKFFASWEPEDDPWEVLCANCPDCPFIHGASGNVPLPSAYSNSTQEGEEPHKRNAVAELTSYLSMALERAAKVQTSKGEDTAEEEEEEERRDRAAVRQSPRSNQAEETQGMEAGSLQVKSKVKRKTKKSGKAKSSDAAEEFPSAVLGTGEESEGDTTPRTILSKEEWNHFNILLSNAVKSMQSRWNSQMTTADNKLDNLKIKVQSLQNRTRLVARGDWLEPKRKEVEAIDRECEEKRKVSSSLQEEIEGLQRQAEENRRELELLKNQEALKDEWDRKVREAVEEVEELQDTKSRLEGEISELEDHKQEMVDQAESDKERIRQDITSLKASKKEVENQMVELEESIQRRTKVSPPHRLGRR